MERSALDARPLWGEVAGGKSPTKQDDTKRDEMNEEEKTAPEAVRQSAPSAGQEFFESGKTIVYAIVIALVIRMFAFEPFNIPSSSMEPGLLVGDYLFVSKYAYGYSNLSSFMGFAPFKGRLLAKEPKRGDVIVFKLPRDPKIDYIKRLIGLPGDRVQVRHGLLHINGAPVERARLPALLNGADTNPDDRAADYRETLPGGVSHIIREEGDDRYLDDTEIFTVPEGFYFFMGDNRDNSLDSRTPNVGFVPRDNLVGRAEFLFFSVNADRVAESPIYEWPLAIRWSRLFEAIR